MVNNLSSHNPLQGILGNEASTRQSGKKVRFSNQVTEVAIPRLGKRVPSSSYPQAKKSKTDSQELTNPIQNSPSTEQIDSDELKTYKIINKMLLSEKEELENKFRKIYFLGAGCNLLNVFIKNEKKLLLLSNRELTLNSSANLSKIYNKLLVENGKLNSAIQEQLTKIPQADIFYEEILKDEMEGEDYLRILGKQATSLPLTQSRQLQLDNQTGPENSLEYYKENNALLKERNKELGNKLEVYEVTVNNSIQENINLNQENQELRDQINVKFKETINEEFYRQALDNFHKLYARLAVVTNAARHLSVFSQQTPSCESLNGISQNQNPQDQVFRPRVITDQNQKVINPRRFLPTPF